MAKKNSKPKKTPPLMKRLAKDPIATSKREWAKLPGVAKIGIILAGMGATGIGAAQVVGFGRIGQAVAPIVNWGARLRGKLGS
jgi:hypothetical protein